MVDLRGAYLFGKGREAAERREGSASERDRGAMAALENRRGAAALKTREGSSGAGEWGLGLCMP